MAVYVIADLHLSKSAPSKCMDVFGNSWKNYQDQLEKAWKCLIRDNDTVIIPGDISWALSLEEAYEDFSFLNALPGRKYIGKGNHDFFWTSVTKMKSYFAQNHFDTLNILYNNAVTLEDEGLIVCGTRGWFMDESNQSDSVNADYQKIYRREIMRLKMSLDEAKKQQAETSLPIYAFLHFPPYWNQEACDEIVDLLEAYQIPKCYFGHVHGQYNVPTITTYKGIEMIFIAADFLKFTPYPVLTDKKA